MSTKHIEALKLALEGAANYIDALGGDSRKYRQALAEQPAQPSKPWRGLTDEEAEDIWNHYCDEMGEASINDAPDIARAIESALRSKNT